MVIFTIDMSQLHGITNFKRIFTIESSSFFGILFYALPGSHLKCQLKIAGDLWITMDIYVPSAKQT